MLFIEKKRIFDRSLDNYKNCSRRRRRRSYGIIMGFVERYKISCNDVYLYVVVYVVHAFTISIVDLKPSYVKIPSSSQCSLSCVRYLLIGIPAAEWQRTIIEFGKTTRRVERKITKNQ
uniref:Uncharacterized protein n=1 Tax=Trichogramma kaykai TaxID=54128 RepID=A0ABD2WXP4_9HYME